MLTSPLRYPGGKAKLFRFFASLIDENNAFNCTYCEPYAGGAGLALMLLGSGFVNQIRINDVDDSIFNFWHSIVNDNDRFCETLLNAEISIREWYNQKEILHSSNSNSFQNGFALFYLNRTNRSGIIQGAGPIGGFNQSGEWLIDARFNKRTLIQSISNIGLFKDKIEITNLDAANFLDLTLQETSNLTYLDPPYYVKGKKLYRNSYNHSDHVKIAEIIQKRQDSRWVVSYDDVPPIRNIYEFLTPTKYNLSYSAGARSLGSEVMYVSPALSNKCLTMLSAA